MFHDLRVVLLFENTTGTWLFQQKSVFHRCSLSNFWGSWKGLGTILAPSKVLEIQEQMCVCENINLLSHENTLIMMLLFKNSKSRFLLESIAVELSCIKKCSNTVLTQFRRETRVFPLWNKKAGYPTETDFLPHQFCFPHWNRARTSDECYGMGTT